MRAPCLVATLATVTKELASFSAMTERVPSPLELKMSLRLGSKAAASDLAPIGKVATVPHLHRPQRSTLFSQLEKRRCASGSIANPCGLLQFGIDQWASISLVAVSMRIIADKLPLEGGCAIGDLAAMCKVQPTPLLRILRALAAFGIFWVTAEGTVAHSPQSLRLRKGAPNSLHYAARFFAAPGSWKAWGALDAALTGEIPHHAAWNATRFDYLREHPDEARLYDAFMAQFPDNRHDAIAAAYDFSGAKLIADIGGGNGEALRRILACFATPRGLVFDRPDVVDAISPSACLGGRIEVEGGSFFDRVPAGADLYLLISVLHDWSDEDCVRILRVVRAAMASDARLLVVDHILEPNPAIGNPMMYLIDMQMMAMFGSARERTEAEFGKLLAASGFGPPRLVPTKSRISILEAVPQ